MTLTRATDYGVRAMIYLAGLPQGERASLAELARHADVPLSFLAKVMQRLVRAGLVVSHRGKGGGFELAAGRLNISLLDILNALDGVPALNVCLLSAATCQHHAWCAAHLVWLEARSRMLEVLAAASLNSLVNTTRLQRQAVGLGWTP